jgi:hypothetical protein
MMHHEGRTVFNPPKEEATRSNRVGCTLRQFAPRYPGGIPEDPAARPDVGFRAWRQ